MPLNLGGRVWQENGKYTDFQTLLCKIMWLQESVDNMQMWVESLHPPVEDSAYQIWGEVWQESELYTDFLTLICKMIW